MLTRQPIDLDRPHPFTQAGNTEFNSFIWMPPNAQRAGNILLADFTIFTTLFGGVESLGDLLEEPGNDATGKRDAGEEDSGCRLIRNADYARTARGRSNGTPE